MNTEHTNQSTAPEPFGYFKAEARGWVCPAKEEDGAIALYDRPQAEPVNQQLLALVKSFGHKVGCAKNAFGEQCTCGADEAIAAAEQVTLCASCARADVNCPIYPQQTASCVEHRPAAKQQAEPAARDVIGKLIELTRAVNISLDDSEERDGIDGREHVIGSVNFDAVCDALEALEELPDNKPGWAMNAADKAAWALRHLTDAAQPPAVGVPLSAVGKLRILLAACNRIEAGAEEFESQDGVEVAIAIDYWLEFIDALEEARAMLAAAPKAVATGWIDPNDKTQKQFLPHIGEPVLFCNGGVTYYGTHTGGSFKAGHGVTARLFGTWDCMWMYPPTAAQKGGAA